MAQKLYKRNHLCVTKRIKAPRNRNCHQVTKLCYEGHHSTTLVLD